MPRVVFARIAEQDLEDIEEFIAHDDPLAASDLVDLFREKCTLLATQPEMGRARPELGDGIRSFPVSNFLILYRPVTDGIEVARILRGSRDIDALFG